MSKYGTPWKAVDGNTSIRTARGEIIPFESVPRIVECVNFCGDADLAGKVLADKDKLKKLVYESDALCAALSDGGMSCMTDSLLAAQAALEGSVK